MWRRGDSPLDRIVIDPTIVVALAFYEHLRVDIISALGAAQIVVPECITSDLMNLGAEAVRSGHLDLEEAMILSAFLDQLPVRKISPQPKHCLKLRTVENTKIRHTPYLAAAIQHICIVMSLDHSLTRACRRLHIPRMRFVRQYRLHWKANPIRLHQTKPAI